MKKSLLTIAVVIAASGVRAADYRTGRDGPQTARATDLSNGSPTVAHKIMETPTFAPSPSTGGVEYSNIAGIKGTCPLANKEISHTIFLDNDRRDSGTLTRLANPGEDIPLNTIVDKGMLAMYNQQFGSDLFLHIGPDYPDNWSTALASPGLSGKSEIVNPCAYGFYTMAEMARDRGYSGGKPFDVNGCSGSMFQGRTTIALNANNLDSYYLHIGTANSIMQVGAKTAIGLGFVGGGDMECAARNLVQPGKDKNGYEAKNSVVAINTYDAISRLVNEGTAITAGTTDGLIASAREVCADISDGIDKIKIAAGISVGAGAVGTLAGGAAGAAGFVNENGRPTVRITLQGNVAEAAEINIIDSEITVYKDDDAEKVASAMANAFNANMNAPFTAKANKGVVSIIAKDKGFVFTENYVESITDKLPQGITGEAQFQDKSGVLATVRTAGSFVAGGTQAVAAVSSFIGGSGLDKLAKDMDSCSAIVKEIGDDLMRRRVETPDDPSIEQMAKIHDSCKGLNTKNITDIKKAMTASGVLSTIGAAAGIAGGVTSVMANKNDFGAAPAAGIGGGQDGVENNVAPVVAAANDKSKNLNLASNIMSVAAGATSLIGTIISGTVLASLNKNGDIAAKCKDAF